MGKAPPRRACSNTVPRKETLGVWQAPTSRRRAKVYLGGAAHTSVTDDADGEAGSKTGEADGQAGAEVDEPAMASPAPTRPSRTRHKGTRVSAWLASVPRAALRGGRPVRAYLNREYGVCRPPEMSTETTRP